MNLKHFEVNNNDNEGLETLQTHPIDQQSSSIMFAVVKGLVHDDLPGVYFM